MSAPILLVLDYPGRREESRTSHLRLEDDGWDVRYLLQPPFERVLTSAGYAQRLTARFGPFGSAVAGVLAYCMAAPIAQELAASLRAPLILFDGEPSTVAAVEREVGVAMAQLGWSRNGGPVPHRFPGQQLRDHPRDCVRQMHDVLAPMALSALLADGADDQEAAPAAEQAAGFYLDWLTYLVAAHNTSWPELPGPVLHVVSRRHGCTGDWPGAVQTWLRRVDVERNDLFNHRRTRELTLSFLAETAIHRRALG